MKIIPVEILVNLCNSVVINPAYQPTWVNKILWTRCNFSFQLIAGVFGLKFKGMANKIINEIRISPDWHKVDFHDASKLVNQGALVVAVEEGLIHGHIACLCPGETVWSEKWSLDSPLCGNVGKNNWHPLRGVNWAFALRPDLFVYDPKPPISQDDLITTATTDYPDRTTRQYCA